MIASTTPLIVTTSAATRGRVGYYHGCGTAATACPTAGMPRPYVVNDYAPYRLYSPPYGYHWVRVGDECC
jgi:hypothetical protein